MKRDSAELRPRKEVVPQEKDDRHGILGLGLLGKGVVFSRESYPSREARFTKKGFMQGAPVVGGEVVRREGARP